MLANYNEPGNMTLHQADVSQIEQAEQFVYNFTSLTCWNVQIVVTLFCPIT